MSDTPQQAYISKVHLKGYKSIKDLEVDFKPGLNIIIGPNGSGKTNFLEFLDKSQSDRTYSELINNDFYVNIEIIDEVNYKLKVILDGSFNISKGNLAFEINEKGYIDDTLTQERLISHGQNKNNVKISLIKDNIEKSISQFSSYEWEPIYAGAELVRYSSKYDLERGIEIDLVFSDYISRYTPVGTDNLPYELFALFYENIVSLNIKVVNNSIKPFIAIKREQLIINLKNYTPIKDLKIENEAILIEQTDLERYKLKNLHLKFFVNDKWLNWGQLSDGTRRLFYIFTILNERNGFIFLEEPELGIHPDQLYKLMDFLKEQSKEKQIIITTHSPDVLNILGAEGLDRIIVTKYDAEKGTIMRRLKEPQIKKARKYMESAGLFLSDYWVHSNLEAAAYEAENED